MCKPFNGKMKEFKWRPGIFQQRLNQLKLFSLLRPVLRDERFHRIHKRLVLFADLEALGIQPPCHWNYKLAPDELKIGLMNTECPCGINTEEIHYMDMNELEFNEDGKVIFTSDHDVDFGFGGFYEFKMWTNAEEEKMEKLVEKMKRSNEKTKRSVKSQIVKFIEKTMNAFEQEVLAYEFSTILEAQLSMFIKESTSKAVSSEKKTAGPKISKRKMTSRQKRLQADAIQAEKDAEEAKLKQLEKKKSESVSNGQKKKKTAKNHNFFRKSQKPTKL